MALIIGSECESSIASLYASAPARGLSRQEALVKRSRV